MIYPFHLFCFKSLDQRVTFRLRQMTLNWVEKRPEGNHPNKGRDIKTDNYLLGIGKMVKVNKKKVRLSEKSGCNQ